MKDRNREEKNDKKNIVLDKALQIEIMKFFVATSTPRLLKKKNVKSPS